MTITSGSVCGFSTRSWVVSRRRPNARQSLTSCSRIKMRTVWQQNLPRWSFQKARWNQISNLSQVRSLPAITKIATLNPPLKANNNLTAKNQKEPLNEQVLSTVPKILSQTMRNLTMEHQIHWKLKNSKLWIVLEMREARMRQGAMPDPVKITTREQRNSRLHQLSRKSWKTWVKMKVCQVISRRFAMKKVYLKQMDSLILICSSRPLRRDRWILRTSRLR